MNTLALLAERGADSPFNKWLNQNPLILGLLFLAIGAVLAGYGIVELRRGVARDKYGNEIRGGLGAAIALLRLVGGAVCCVFGLYKMIAG